MTSSLFNSSVPISPAITSVSLINRRSSSTASVTRCRSASVSNSRSKSGKQHDVTVRGIGTTVDVMADRNRKFPETDQPLPEDLLVARYRHVFAGPGGLYRSTTHRPFRRSNSATTMTPTSGGFPGSTAQRGGGRKLSVSVQSYVAFGSTVGQQRRPASATWSSNTSKYRESVNRRPETAVGRHSRQSTAADHHPTESSDVCRTGRPLVVHLAGGDVLKDNEFIIEDDDGDDDDDDRKEEDIDSGFNRDDSFTRGSSTSGQKIDEWAADKCRDDRERHPPEEDLRNPDDDDDDDDRNDVTLGGQLPVTSPKSPLVTQSHAEATLTYVIETPAGGDDRIADTPAFANNENISRRTSTDLELYVTAKPVPSGGIISSLMSTEARQAFFETWREMERYRTSRSPSTEHSHPVANTVNPTEGDERNSSVAAAIRPQRTYSASTATRLHQDRTVRGRKANVISASVVTTSSARRWRLQGTTTSGGHLTTESLRRPLPSAVDDLSNARVPDTLPPSSDSSRMVAVASLSSSASRPRRTATGLRSLSGLVADKKHSGRVLQDSRLVPAEVSAEQQVTAGGDFRITSATYDSRYADMVAAAALDELWRERGEERGGGRWNENLDGLDQIIRNLAVAKCTDWLSKQQQHRHQMLQRKRFPVYD